MQAIRFLSRCCTLHRGALSTPLALAFCVVPSKMERALLDSYRTWPCIVAQKELEACPASHFACRVVLLKWVMPLASSYEPSLRTHRIQRNVPAFPFPNHSQTQCDNWVSKALGWRTTPSGCCMVPTLLALHSWYLPRVLISTYRPEIARDTL